MEKVSLSEKSLQIKKAHLQEYLNEIEQMRTKIITLEEMNQSLRINFDDTIQGIAQKVDKEKEKIYAQVMSDFRSEISKKNERISEMEKDQSHYENYSNALDQSNVKQLQKILSELRLQLDLKNNQISNS